MKKNVLLVFASLLCLACNSSDPVKKLNIEGTWQLVSGTITETGKKATSNYSSDFKMIKIINGTHFSFLKHSSNPKDSAGFDAGGGRYTLSGNQYTEHLDFYADKNWEGKTFDFTVSLVQDTLVQTGIEKVEKAGIDRTIVEKYVLLKK